MKQYLVVGLCLALVLSFASFFSFASWICSLFEHFKHFYFFIGLMALSFFVFKKNFIFIIISLFCIFLNYNIALSLKDYFYSSLPINNFSHSLVFHNVHNGNDTKIYSQKLKSEVSSDLLVFFEVNKEMSEVLSSSIIKSETVLSDPSEDNYGWAIFGGERLREEKKFEIEGSIYIRKIYILKQKITLFLVHLPPPLFPELWEIESQALSWAKDEIKKTKGKILMVGDFNLTPWSYEYRELCREFSKKDIKPITTLYRPSWPSFFPLLPIDHVFSNFAVAVERRSSLGSDHHLYLVRF